MLVCEYCPDKPTFKFKAELEIHIREVHPLLMKERGVGSYFQVLLNRESSGYYVRQINYYRRKWG